MAYVTGTATSLTDLLTAIQNACTTNGWTLSAGGVLSKDNCYAEIKINGSSLTIRAGRGVDGSGNLSGATNMPTGTLGAPAGTSASVPATTTFAFPMSYFVHLFASPNEVYVVVNYSTEFYETIAFGTSGISGLTGSGNWYCGSRSGGVGTFMNASGEGNPSSRSGTYSLFVQSWSGGYAPEGVDHSLDSVTWNTEGAFRDWASVFFRQPNVWNGDSVLIPIRVYAGRPSGFISPVLECANARHVNIANLADQQIITLGSDRWKVYPWWRRGNAFNAPTSGSNPGTYTGCAGHAIRYDGP